MCGDLVRGDCWIMVDVGGTTKLEQTLSEARTIRLEAYGAGAIKVLCCVRSC